MAKPIHIGYSDVPKHPPAKSIKSSLPLTMPFDVTLHYSQDFQSSVAAIVAVLNEWFVREQTAMPNLDRFEDAIYLKGADRTLMYGNSAYLASFSPRRSPIGRRGEAYLDATLTILSIKTDELILGGALSIDVHHIGSAADGHLYEQLTHKQALPANAAGAVIVGVTRRLVQLGIDDNPHQKSLELLASVFQNLPRDDQELCRMLAMGETSKDIAESLNCSTRTVENRRARIMNLLELDKPVDIVKLMVRFTDRRLIQYDI